MPENLICFSSSLAFHSLKKGDLKVEDFFLLISELLESCTEPRTLYVHSK